MAKHFNSYPSDIQQRTVALRDALDGLKLTHPAIAAAAQPYALGLMSTAENATTNGARGTDVVPELLEKADALLAEIRALSAAQAPR